MLSYCVHQTVCTKLYILVVYIYCSTTQHTVCMHITGINEFFATVYEKTDDTRTPKTRWLFLVNNEMFHQFGSCTKCATDS